MKCIICVQSRLAHRIRLVICDRCCIAYTIALVAIVQATQLALAVRYMDSGTLCATHANAATTVTRGLFCRTFFGISRERRARTEPVLLDSQQLPLWRQLS
jgi:hypothetical protein